MSCNTVLETYLEPIQTSLMELLCVNSKWLKAVIFVKKLHHRSSHENKKASSPFYYKNIFDRKLIKTP